MAERAGRAFWVTAPGKGEIRDVDVPPPGPDEMAVRAVVSGISRGTESLVFRGAVPENQYVDMRGPFQEGEFPAPVKYGYSMVGVTADGDRVFCLYPHQDRFVVPRSALVPIPDAVPDRRAALAANMGTAVNAMWDAGIRLGDRVAVVGAGTIGCLTAALAARHPSVTVELVDINPNRQAVADALGATFALPDAATPDADVVFHASATSDGLATALRLAGFEATVVELSWYGDKPVSAPLGEGFHYRRLTLRSSQVSTVATARRARRSRDDRQRLALSLLRDPAFDVLITGESRFETLPATMARLATDPGDTLCHVVTYT
ncbi:MAG: zinc-binding alcohol dehydrogenase [Alphaproteobacteria bacterium]|nr:zinc-binding alcohol dehydrogenase [Alphaproteobacteria bacterium]